MRYRFIDRIVSLTADPPRIEVVKTFDADDDALSGPLGPDRVPPSLVLELLATTGGQLLYRHLGKDRLPMLLKVEDFCLAGDARPGVPLIATATVQGVAPAAANTMARTVAEVVDDGGRLIASGRFFYLCVKMPEGAEAGDLAPAVEAVP